MKKFVNENPRNVLFVMKLLNTIIMRIILLCAGLKQDSVISVKGEFRIKIGQLISLKNVKNSSKKMRFKDKKKLN
jgi:hypothetical protein